MVIKICPRCERRYLVNSDCDDFIHECNSGNSVLDNEDIKIIGSWEDYTGSGVGQNPNMQGIANELFGTRAALEGAKFGGVTKRGAKKQLIRSRQHLEFIDEC